MLVSSISCRPVFVFIQDFFRAATTCVRFFLGDAGNPARSFKDLYNRLDYLDRAKRHLETALKEKAIVKSTFVSHIGSLRTDEPESSSLIQEVPVSELKSHLNTIDLQIKVLNFFKERERVFNENVPGTVPTLFGKGQERAEVVSKVAFCLLFCWSMLLVFTFILCEILEARCIL